MATATAQEALTPEQAAANLAGHQRARKEASPAASGNNRKPATSSTAKAAGHRKGDRWAAYNGFVDVIAPRLTLAEQAVWHVMFRHARDWSCETSARRLAQAAGINKATASRALQTLEAVGLVRPIWKSTDKSKASRYAMHPRPADCLADIVSTTTRQPYA